MLPCEHDNDIGIILYEWENVKKKFDDMETEIASFREWFKSLDVSKEVSDYINSLDESGRLAELIGGALNETMTVVIPGGEKNGTCVLFVSTPTTGDRRALVVDLGADEGVSVCNTLARMGVSKAVLCITHLHNDHVTIDGVQRLCTAVSVEHVYMSHPDWDVWRGRDYHAVLNEITAYLDGLNVPYTRVYTEGFEIPAGILHLRCTASNCSPESYAPYYHDNWDENMLHTDYDTELNNFSTVYTVEYGKHRFVCTGDIMPTAESNTYVLKAVSGADYYTVPHHGLNITADSAFAHSCSGVGIVGEYGSSSADRLSAGYPDTYGKTLFINRGKDVVLSWGLYDSSIEGATLPVSDTFAGYFLYSGTDVRELPPGVYYSPTADHTATLRGLPDRITSGFILRITRGARSENNYELQTLYGWHSTVYRYNKSVGVWTYTEGTRC